MSEAFQPILRYPSPTSNPGVPFGTRMFEISSSPVRAVIVVKREMSVPALVMNCFAPLITHSPSSSRAVVRTLPASEPASGSVRPKPAERLAAAQPRHPLLLLLLRAERVDRVGAEARVLGERDRDARIDPRELLDDDRVRQVAGVRAAVLLGVGDAHQPELAELRDDLVREPLLAVELLGDGLHLLLREVAHQAADVLLFVGQVELHEARGAY